MRKPSGRILLLLVLLSALPIAVKALDFRNWREDGQQIAFTTTFQQASNQAFNLYDSILDTGFGDFSLFWVGEKQESGGPVTGGVQQPSSYTPQALYGCFGDAPAPSSPLFDNRSEDAEILWSNWPVVSTMAAPPPAPTFTPNVP